MTRKPLTLDDFSAQVADLHAAARAFKAELDAQHALDATCDTVIAADIDARTDELVDAYNAAKEDAFDAEYDAQWGTDLHALAWVAAPRFWVFFLVAQIVIALLAR
jgi:hypothetical protein